MTAQDAGQPTLVIIKPDAIVRGLTGAVLSRLTTTEVKFVFPALSTARLSTI